MHLSRSKIWLMIPLINTYIYALINLLPLFKYVTVVSSVFNVQAVGNFNIQSIPLKVPRNNIIICICLAVITTRSQEYTSILMYLITWWGFIVQWVWGDRWRSVDVCNGVWLSRRSVKDVGKSLLSCGCPPLQKGSVIPSSDIRDWIISLYYTIPYKGHGFIICTLYNNTAKYTCCRARFRYE